MGNSLLDSRYISVVCCTIEVDGGGVDKQMICTTHDRCSSGVVHFLPACRIFVLDAEKPEGANKRLT